MFDDGHQIAVACHHGSDEFECADSGARISDMGITAYPTLIPDGQPEPTYPYSYASLEAVINERMAIDAPGTIGVSGSLVNGDLTINVTVEKDTGAEMPNARVQVVVTEIDIPYTDPNYNNEMNFVNRDMILDNNGSVLTFNGNTAEASVTGTLDPSWDQDNLIIVVWVEDGSTLDVFQATREDIEMFLADPGAPAIPTDLVSVPDPAGSLSCDISWTNPSLNFSGNTLTELMEMRLYRDGELIYTDSNPTIGGTGNYTDVPTESGLYSYMILGYNSFGEGPGAIASTWVGEDVPNVVENLSLIQTTAGVLSATLAWDNPSTGLNGGAFNEPITGYNIIRSDGTNFEITSITNEFTDDSIPFTGNYWYSVQPYNSIGDGGIAESNLVLISDGSILFIEGFESGLLPVDWTIEYNVGNIDWMTETGGNSGNPAAAHGGTYNALFYGGSYTGNITYLITQQIDASSFNSLDFSFWHAQTVWAGDQDELKVHYRLAEEDPWIELAHYTANIADWISETISIPATSGTLQIAFEGIDGYGYGVCLDDIMLVGVGGTNAQNELIPVYTTSLGHNYPNPFNPTTNINYNVYGEEVQTELVIYNIKGQKVKQLISEKLSTGKYTIVWNGEDEQGSKVSSGVYFYKMKAGTYQETKKMILMK